MYVVSIVHVYTAFIQISIPPVPLKCLAAANYMQHMLHMYISTVYSKLGYCMAYIHVCAHAHVFPSCK